ncbi:MAG: TolC family protein [Selenomonadaceae bacterium]|nr:TolC family protein [Selenomonadaceae bacterium]
MSRKKFCAAIFSAAFLFHSISFAAESVTMSLDKAIDLALENNHAITQYQTDREAAQWRLSEIRRNGGPRLSWQSSAYYIGGKRYKEDQEYYARYHFYYDDEDWERTYNDGNDLPKRAQYQSEVYHSLSLSMPLYTGGNLENQIQGAEYALNVADLRLEYAKQYVRYQATEAYLQVLQRNDNIKVQQEAVNFLQSHLDSVQFQYEVGTVAKADVLSTSVQLANYKRNLNSAWGDYESAVATLNNVIGLPVDTVLVTDEDLQNTPYPLNEEECTEYALEHRPDGIAALYSVRQAQTTVDGRKSGYRPSINAQANASSTGEAFFDSKHINEYWQIGLSMQWNLFDNGITDAQIKQAKLAEEKAESQLKQQLDQIRLDVHTAYIELLTAEKNVNVSAAAVTEAEDAYEIAKVRYNEGVDTNLNVMDAQEKVAVARNNYYNSLYTYNVSKAKLDRVIGIPVQIDAFRYVSAVENGKKSSPKALESSDIINPPVEEQEDEPVDISQLFVELP